MGKNTYTHILFMYTVFSCCTSRIYIYSSWKPPVIVDFYDVFYALFGKIIARTKLALRITLSLPAPGAALCSPWKLENPPKLVVNGWVPIWRAHNITYVILKYMYCAAPTVIALFERFWQIYCNVFICCKS